MTSMSNWCFPQYASESNQSCIYFPEADRCRVTVGRSYNYSSPRLWLTSWGQHRRFQCKPSGASRTGISGICSAQVCSASATLTSHSYTYNDKANNSKLPILDHYFASGTRQRSGQGNVRHRLYPNICGLSCYLLRPD